MCTCVFRIPIGSVSLENRSHLGIYLIGLGIAWALTFFKGPQGYPQLRTTDKEGLLS